MTTTEHAPNYVAVIPAKGKVTGSPTGEGGDVGPHAQPRAGARDAGIVGTILGKVRAGHAARRTPTPPVEVGDRPDLWRRNPLALTELCERYRDDIAQEWLDKRYGAAVVDTLFAGFVGLPFSAVGYGFAFCSQAKHRAAWLALGLACLVAYLTL